MAATLLDIGNYLRQAREERGLTVEAVAQAVKIRSQYIYGIEQGDLSLLPPTVYVRGFIEKYAELLGLDGRALANEYNPPTQAEINKPISRPPLFQPRPFHLWLVYVVMIMGVVGGLSAVVDRRTNLPDPALLQEAIRSQVTPAGTAPNAASTEAPLVLPFQTLSDWTYIAGVFPERDQSAIRVSSQADRNPNIMALAISIVERASWVRVTVDSETVFEGTLQPGTQEAWEAEDTIVLRAGNAGGVLVTLNDEDLGALGEFGEVKEQEFRRVQ